jgi:hypothetical protein
MNDDYESIVKEIDKIHNKRKKLNNKEEFLIEKLLEQENG